MKWLYQVSPCKRLRAVPQHIHWFYYFCHYFYVPTLRLIFLEALPTRVSPDHYTLIDREENGSQWPWPRIQGRRDWRLLVKLGPKEPGRLLGGSLGGVEGIGQHKVALRGSQTRGKAGQALSHPTPKPGPWLVFPHLLESWSSWKTKASRVSALFWGPGLMEGLSAGLQRPKSSK